MARVYLSFLGTNKYIRCNYAFDDGDKKEDVRFVQEATVGHHCSDWGPDDRILIFLTSKARQMNWETAVTTLPTGERGLGDRLARLGLAARIETRDIPDGADEDQIYRVFQAIVEALAPGDRVVFDITHAFRSIPMLALVALNYCKALKGIEVEAIVYGAFEVLGSVVEAKELPIEDRTALVFDLTGYDELLAWSTAVDRFRSSGDARLATELARHRITPVLRAQKGADEQMKALQKLAGAIERFSNTMATCRGKRVGDDAANLRRQLDEVQRMEAGGRLPALAPLFALLQRELEAYGGEPVADGLRAVRWCLDRNLIQQGYTLLEETAISWLAMKVGLDPDSRRERELASQAFWVFYRGIDRDEWYDEVKRRPELVERIGSVLAGKEAIGKMFDRLVQERNDLNHAGFQEDALEDGGKFADKLESHIAELERLLGVGGASTSG